MCPLGHEDHNYLGRLGRREWYRCRQCGVEYSYLLNRAEDDQTPRLEAIGTFGTKWEDNDKKHKARDDANWDGR